MIFALVALAASVSAVDPVHYQLTRNNAPHKMSDYAAAAEVLRGKYGYESLTARQERVTGRKRQNTASIPMINQVCCTHCVLVVRAPNLR